MTISLGDAAVYIKADTTQLSQGIDGAKVLMLGLGAAAAGAAGAALKMAGDLQQQNTMLATSAGEQVKNLAMIQAGVLKTSVDTGTSTTQLESAMYKIESANIHGSAVLDALTAAARGAKLENSDLGVVADAESTIMVDFSSKHVTATQAMNDLIATVARGKTNIQDLSASMASVLPTAAAVGASLYDTSAAMATMTAEGSPAANAATYLRQMLLALEVPGSKAVTVFKEVGLTTTQVSDEMKVSLPATLQLITDAIGKKFPEGSAAYVAALKDVAGGQKNFQAWLELTGAHLATFKQNADQVTASVKDAGTQISGWAQIQGNFNLQIDKAHAALDAVAIKIGTDLMPVASQFFGWVTAVAIPALSDLESAFMQVVTPVQTVAATINAATIPIQDTIAFMTPLVDAFDRHSVAVTNVNTKIVSLTDAFDRHNITVATVVQNTTPLIDAFDRHSNAIADVGKKTATTQQQINPFLDLVKNLVTTAQNVGSVFRQEVLPPVEKLGGDALTLAGHFDAWLQSSGLLNLALHDVADTVATVVGWVDGFITGLTNGDPWVRTVAISVGILGTAIGAVKIAEFGAGVYNAFQKLADGNGILANLATKAFPELGQALGWTKTAAADVATAAESIGTKATSASAIAKAEVASLTASVDTAAAEVTTDTAIMEADLTNVGTSAITAGTEVTAIGASAVEAEGVVAGATAGMDTAIAGVGTEATAAGVAVDTAATGMSVAMGIATLGISASFGILAAAWVLTQNDITTGTEKMSTDAQAAYNKLGNSAADNAAKAKAMQIQSADNVASEANVSAGKSRGYWTSSYYQNEQDSTKAKVQQVLDQQAIADAANTAATKAAQSWDTAYTKASTSGDIVALLQQAGWAQGAIAQYLAGSHINTVSDTSNSRGHYASGGVIAPGDVGIVGDPGPYAEMIEGGTQGVSVLPAGPTAALRQGLVYGQQYPQPSGGGGNWGGGGGGGSRQPIHIHLIQNGHETAMAIVEDMFAVDALGHAVVKQMRQRTGIRY